LSIKTCCDFCGGETLEHAYTPINSARGMEVFLCNRCGLAQSFPTKPYESRPPGSMSADANRSSYRYTKDVISDRYDECFTHFVDFSNVCDVLDVGSNRGAFIRYLGNRHPGKRIVAVEPDPTITSGYASLPDVSVQTCRFEHAQLPENHFDFSYCAHTLEHADSAREMLLGIRRALKPGGLLFIAVPSLIFYRDIIEEIFIDPHTYHFNFHLLKDFASQAGFTVEYAGKPEDPELMLLLKKKDEELIAPSFIPSDPSHAAKEMPKIRRYANDIHLNRAAMKESVRRLNEAGDRYKLVIWGAGRIFDALVRFGELNMSKVYLVVDKYLHRYVDTLHGCRLTSPDTLRQEAPETLLLYIASRDYADEIQTEASAMGIANFIRFSTESSDTGKHRLFT
jgi:SAM-dependent methyltransferase